MIYSPSRFVFIHIPRTGGLSITQSIASRVLDVGDVTINLSGLSDLGYWRHTRACEMASLAPWSSLYRWAVARSPWEMVESFWRLSQRDLGRLAAPAPASPRSARDYWRYLYVTSRLTFEEWIPWHYEYLRGSGGFWSYWCCGRGGGDLGVEPIRYERLAEEWPGLCERLGFGWNGLPLLWVNRAPGEVEWTPAAIAAVADLCPDDVERFGYTPTVQAAKQAGAE